MTIADLASIEGRTYPAGRRTQNLVGGASPIKAGGFSMGYVTLDPGGGQVPWHNHPNEEVYFIVSGTAEACVGRERREVHGGQALYVPPGTFHQLTNLGTDPLVMMYAYSPAGDVSHWRQELDGTLPRAGAEAPPLPAGARPQRGLPPAAEVSGAAEGKGR
jgi:mannose-6-phosphate isomerase-like protein (cupin superfamily)